MNVLEMIYPNKCPFCSKVVPMGNTCCKSCELNTPKNDLINQFTVKNNSFKTISPYIYKDGIKKAIWRFKFRNHKEYAEHFAKAISSSLKDHFSEINFDYVTSVPISKKRLKERGYNQTELFAKKLAKLLNVKYKRLLLKTVDNLEQHTLPASERERNVENVYAVKKYDIIVKKKILLCDDIITTGNTISECRKTLLLSGANEVLCATIAIARSN